MDYGATWSVFIEGEDLDLIEVAKRARDIALDPAYPVWEVNDGRTRFIVDLTKQIVIDAKPILSVEEHADGTISWEITVDGPDSRPMQLRLESGPVRNSDNRA
ncbi:hypothetical protein ABFW14_13745 [Mycolicibacterium fortuitum]|uniref:hypothetical protein n=1 Tax=Mycolicibacterium fortuitum TaxID=1766 RepID=UPI0007EC80AB|nr:hypothetical protein [Mycolicibacterium fortuitum]OBK05187.1 hypothetical protein A5637_10385 [Mycolicibacterium fortuitum]